MLLACRKYSCYFNNQSFCKKDRVDLDKDGKCIDEPPFNLMAWLKVTPPTRPPLQAERRIPLYC